MTHVLIVFAKLNFQCSKTRLRSTVGDDIAESLSKAMLADILEAFSKADTLYERYSIKMDLVLYFAPDTFRAEASQFLVSMGEEIASKWKIVSMPSYGGGGDLSSCNLSVKLAFALTEIANKYDTVTFVGSDCPCLPLSEILAGVRAAIDGDAFLSPAEDGGYVMLSMPSSASSRVFQGVVWSSPSTLESQIESIEQSGMSCRLGNTYTDVDEEEDLDKVQKHLQQIGQSSRTLDVLRRRGR